MPIKVSSGITLGQEVTVTPEQMAHCAKEPIHLLNTIQAYGTLLVCDEQHYTIHAYAENILEHFDFLTAEFENKTVEDLFPFTVGFNWIDAFDNAQSTCAMTIGKMISPNKKKHWEVSLYKTALQNGKSQLVVEFIPCYQYQMMSGDTLLCKQFVKHLTEKLEELQQMKSLEDFTNKCCQLIQEFTKFDRVFLYQFDEDWSGQIISEVTRPGMNQEYLGQHFPEGDIPEQARQLFLKNPIRITQDFNAPPCQVVDKQGKLYLLDQSYGLLRQPSNMHVIYMRNIGVCSSLTISLVYEGKLWGMLSCHHFSPKSVLNDERSALFLASKLLSIGINSYLNNLIESERMQREAEESECLLQIGNGYESQEKLIAAWRNEQLRLQTLFKASYVSLVLDGVWYCSPNIDQALLQNLIHFAGQHGKSGRFSTDSLAAAIGLDVYAKANLYGCFVKKVTNIDNAFIVIFRPEIKKVEQWGGNPNTSTEIISPQGGIVLGPRTSFAIWEKKIAHKSFPFNNKDFKFMNKVVHLLDQLLLSLKVNKNEKSLALLGFSVEHSNDSIMITDLNETIQYVNQAIINHTGYSREEMVGVTPRLLQGAKTDPKVLREFRKAIDARQPIQRMVINYKKNGEPFYNEININPVFDKDGIFLNFLSIQRDVTEKIKAKLEIEASQRDLDLTLKIIPDLILEFNDEETLLASNKRDKLTGGNYCTLASGETLAHFFPKNIVAVFRRAFKYAKKTGCVSNVEFELSANGATQYLSLSVSIKQNQRQGKPTYVCLLHDITNIREKDNYIYQLAHNDALTGVYNRRAFHKRITELHSEALRFERYYAVLYLDLDQFKLLNDTRGHEAGDEVLIEISKRLSRHVRVEDVVARMGGDEFVILLTNFTSQNAANRYAVNVANKINKTCRQPFLIKGSHYRLTCSIGAAIGGGQVKKKPEMLIRNADMAM